MAEEQQEKSAIERFKEGLYRRKEQPKAESADFYEREFTVPEDWNTSVVVGEGEPLMPPPERFSSFFTMKRLFIASLIFFSCAVAFFLFVTLRGSNIVSTRNVSILVDGPVSAKAGEALSLKVIIENKNNTALEFADLFIEYPEGTRVAKNLEEELTRFRKSLGTIGPRKTVTETVDAVLYGQEGDEKEIAITLEYRTEDSNAISLAEKKYQVHINASPFTLRVSMPKEVSAKQEFEFEVSLVSETNEAIEDVLVFADYPFGFTFQSASPEPSFGNDTWFLGDLPIGGKRTVKIRGALLGQDGDEKIFRIEGGLVDKNVSQKIGVVYGTSLESVRIVKPSLSISLSLLGSDAEEIAVYAGRRIDGGITLRNNTPTKIKNARATLGFLGEILEKSSVATSEGFYRSLDATIVWDKNTYDALSEIAPGKNVRLPFSFQAFSPLGSAVRIKNPVIELTAVAEGEHLTEEGVFQNVRVETSHKAKINSDIEFTQRPVYYEGPFVNSGPIPPKADTETTYTIFWRVVNTSNDLRDISAHAVLPPYIRWMGQVSPATEDLSYNPDQRTVTWRALEIKAWKGIASLPHEVAFQIGFLPSVGQVGQAPELILPASFSGVDSFTSATLSAQGGRATTEATTDAQFRSGDGTVVQ